MRRPSSFPLLVVAAVCGGFLAPFAPFVPSLRAVSEGNGAGTAKAFVVIDAGTGHVLASREAEAKVQVGSLTKVATAIIVLDWADSGGGRSKLDDPVTIAPAALTAGGANPVGLAPGDVVSARDLLYAALLGSDNVAAEALAEHVGRSLGGAAGGGGGSPTSATVAFVAQMNALARALGMERTRFLNPTGVDVKEKPFSTAADLARLTRHALEKASFRFIVAQKERRITIVRPGAAVPPPAPAPPATTGGFTTTTTTSSSPAAPASAPAAATPTPTPVPGVVVTVRNTNELLGIQRIDGVKTGQTARAGNCLILTAEREKLVKPVPGQPDAYDITQRRLIVVLLGSPDRFREGAALLNRGQNLYDAWAAAGKPTGEADNRR